MEFFKITPIRAQEDEAIAQVITEVGTEFGAIGEGYGPSDAEVSCMSRYYLSEQNAIYLVATLGAQIVGGCGIAPLVGVEGTCELKKLFLLPEGRGLGIGKSLVTQCLEFACERGFSQCYLDTLANMTVAISLYENLGFKHLDRQIGGTGHSGCDVWMIKTL